LAKKALTKHCCNSPFPKNLAVTTTLFFMPNKHLRGIKMSIQFTISSTLAFGAALFGVLMPISIAQANDAKYVSVPSNYVYDTSGRSRPISHHDYCTKSPDEFPNPIGKNASFRGPCARHDMCYGSSTDKKKCDAQLWLDMRSNCKYTYSSFISPTRKACYKTAATYLAVVVALP
jgi:hypothetical protein